ncbi:MAG: hypothetical protein JO328_06675 [Hyphomicrobiales bacterium]|nr:hypothetical protein [Hyphomicrobiales bacterium]MBV8827583.1 hypothetical protein [Hyphomicrobiales bacterium]
MTRILLIVAVALLLTGRASAQSEANCEEIRQAVAQYGYEDARRHALIHYGAEAVEAGEKKCLAGMIPAKPAATKASLTKPAAKHHEAKKHKPTAPAARVQESSK